MSEQVSQEKRTPSPSRTVVHEAFAKRVQKAIDTNREIPLPNFGRLQWFVDQLKTKFDIETNVETVRRWLAGETLPRNKNAMSALAALLHVDQGWLAYGSEGGGQTAPAKKLRDAAVSGVVNAVAGFMQMDGAEVEFPSDSEARQDGVDISAVIRGANYRLHVALAKKNDDNTWTFAVPKKVRRALVLGVIPSGPTSIEVIDLDADVLKEMGVEKANDIELKVDSKHRAGTYALKQIQNFRTRL